MDNLTINWREELIKLFPKTTQRTKGKHDEWCSACNGIGLANKGDYIVGCVVCNGMGIKKACECGQKIDFSYYNKCSNCRSKEFKKIQSEKDGEMFKKAKKVPFNEYEGKFLWNEYVLTSDELEEKLENMIYDNDELPRFIWGTKKEKVFDEIDLEDIIHKKCEDGYDDMVTYFNFKDEDFVNAQNLLNKWLKKHDNILNIYYEDYKTTVLLDNIISKIKKTK